MDASHDEAEDDTPDEGRIITVPPVPPLQDIGAACRFMAALQGDTDRQCEVIELLRMLADDTIDVTMDGVDPDVVERAQDCCALLGI